VLTVPSRPRSRAWDGTPRERGGGSNGARSGSDPDSPTVSDADDPPPMSRRLAASPLGAMSQGQVGPLFEAMAEDVTWHWMGVSRWSRSFEGKQTVVDEIVWGSHRDTRPVVQR
jgi:hypothetical protein